MLKCRRSNEEPGDYWPVTTVIFSVKLCVSLLFLPACWAFWSDHEGGATSIPTDSKPCNKRSHRRFPRKERLGWRLLTKDQGWFVSGQIILRSIFTLYVHYICVFVVALYIRIQVRLHPKISLYVCSWLGIGLYIYHMIWFRIRSNQFTSKVRVDSKHCLYCMQVRILEAVVQIMHIVYAYSNTCVRSWAKYYYWSWSRLDSC